MGLYINPTQMRKSDWVRENAIPCSKEDLIKHVMAPGDIVPLALVDRGLFLALAVVFDQRELAAIEHDVSAPVTFHLCDMDTLAREFPQSVEALKHYGFAVKGKK